jgi:hypothetical protein
MLFPMSTGTNKLLRTALAVSFGFAAALSLALAASAQAVPGPVTSVRAVEGSVVIERGGTRIVATADSTLQSGDFLLAGAGSRAQVVLGDALVMRIAENTQVRFADLTPGRRKIQLALGTLALSEAPGSTGGPALEAPSLTLRPEQGGLFRLTVQADGTTSVTVRIGSASVITGAGTQIVKPGSTLVASGPYANPTIVTQSEIPLDDFDSYR